MPVSPSLARSFGRPALFAKITEPQTSSTCLLDLPVELLVEICWLSENPGLLLVCHGLHEIICSTPRFWGDIHLGHSQSMSDDAHTFLGQYLARGRSCLLDVTIQSSGPAEPSEVAQWNLLSLHRQRLRSIDIESDREPFAGRILQHVLLPCASSVLPSCRRLAIRPSLDAEEGKSYPLHEEQRKYHLSNILRPVASLLPALTSLTLPFARPCIPHPGCPLNALETLVLIGLSTYCSKPASFYQLAYLLSQTPRLQTLWCKEDRMYYHTVLPEGTAIMPQYMPGDATAASPVSVPIELPHLTRAALGVPGIGTWLMHAIRAPKLRDLHMDGMRDEDAVNDWSIGYPEMLHEALRVTATRSPALRRIACLGVYATRGTWEWLLGCGQATEMPFPLLESLAVRELDAFKWQCPNMFDDAVVELYARQGHVHLHRFVHTGSEPRITGAALHQLVLSIIRRDDMFEFELDSHCALDTKERLRSLMEIGIKAIIHEEPVNVRGWWTMGRGLDPTEEDSY